MDDFSELLGFKLTPEQTATLSEMARRAQDRLLCYNPTTGDYYIEWSVADGNGGRFLVPGKDKDIGYGTGRAIHPRYIAFKFFKEIAQRVLSEQLLEAVKLENERRLALGFKPMDKSFDTQEELRFSDPYLVNNEDKLQNLLPQIILGVVQEYGLDAPAAQKSDAQRKWEDIQRLVNRPVDVTGQQTAPQPPAEATPAPAAPEEAATPKEEDKQSFIGDLQA